MKEKLILGTVVAFLLAVASVSVAFAGGGSRNDHQGDDALILHVTLKHTARSKRQGPTKRETSRSPST